MPGSAGSISSRLHPVVLFNICDSFIRRNEGQERVIGTLLGNVEDGVVEITNSYAVPHNESMDQVAVDIEFHKTMFDLHQRVNAGEVIVGWYSTGSALTGSDALIQDFFGREIANPIHLMVDCLLNNDEMSIKAFTSNTLTVGDQQLGAQFQQVQLDMRMIEAERVGLELLQKSVTEKLPTDIEGLQGSMEKLEKVITAAWTYVDDVVEGRRKANNDIGRYLADTVAGVPKMTSDEFDQLFNDSVQDVLLVMYLANLTRAQLSLAEQLNTAALPL